MQSSDVIKDTLFDDDLFWLLVDTVGSGAVYSSIEGLLSDLTFQLRTIDKGEKWRRGVTALVIRGKARLRLLEGEIYE